MYKKLRWILQINWNGKWRTIFESDKRTDLTEYARKCPESVELRIVDSTVEEVKQNGRRRNK